MPESEKTNLMLDHFGFLAPFYERFIKPQIPDQLIQLLDLRGDDMLLDVGGGTGRISQFFTQLSKLVVLADLSQKMLVESQSKKDLHAACSHSEYLPFPDQYYDRVIMIDALHHVCDQGQTAHELWRVLKPGGRIIIEEPDIHHPVVKLVALGEKLALMRSHFLNGGQISDLFESYAAKRELHQDGHIIRVVIEKPKK